MAQVTIKLIPNQTQLDVFSYSNDYVSTWEYLAETFKGPLVDGEIGLVQRPAKYGGISLGIWIDGICVPYEWCTVTNMTKDEAKMVSDLSTYKKFK
tara:strand:- start:206 stop:493 length:288 start_codon:yes stop_codon:yes gene_type:complete